MARLTAPCPLRAASRNKCLVPGILQEPGAGTTVVCVIFLLSSKAIAIKGLNVEPGGYKPCVTRLINGRCQLSLNFFQLSLSIPSINKLGSNVGLETNAKIPPVCGLMATNAPRLFPIKRSASCCNRMSIDKRKVCPVFGGSERITRIILPAASFSTS